MQVASRHLLVPLHADVEMQVKLLDQRLFWGGYRSRYLLSEDE